MAFDQKSLLAFYKSEHRIYGRCPHCQEPFRLSAVKLTYGVEPPRDVVTRLQKERERLEAELNELEETIADLEAESQRKLEDKDLAWASRVSGEVEKRLSKQVREIRRRAIEASRKVSLGKLAEKLAPFIPGFGYDFSDVRPMFEPIDFIVFDGLAARRVEQLVFIEFKTGKARLNDVQESIMDAVSAKRVKFETVRLSEREVARMRRREASRAPLLVVGDERDPTQRRERG